MCIHVNNMISNNFFYFYTYRLKYLNNMNNGYRKFYIYDLLPKE